MRKFSHFYTILIFISVILSSCVKEALDDVNTVSNTKGIKTTMGFALPLIDAYVGVKDVYNNSGNNFIRVENDKSFTFVYTQRDSIPQAPQFNIPADTIDYAMKVDANSALTFNNLGNFSQALSNYAPFPTENNQQLRQIYIKSGSFRIIATTSILHKTFVGITFPSMTNRAGQPITIPIDLTYDGSTSPIVIDTTVSLNDVTIDLTDQGISYNVLPYMFEVSLDKVPGNPAIVAGDSLQIREIVKINEYRGLNGYVGKFLMKKVAGSNNIDLFENQNDVSVQLKDPRLKFSIANGFGIPVTFKINKISMTNVDGTEFPIQIGFLKDTFTLPAPTVVGTYAYGVYSIDRSNSNLDDIINNGLQNAPKAVNYDVEIYSNYAPGEPDNFLFDTSTLKVDIGMEIPLDLKVGNFSYNKIDSLKLFTDTADQSFKYDPNEITLATETQNGLPLNIRLQYTFGKWNPALKDSFEAVDSLFDNGLILTKAVVDTNGKIVQSLPQSSLATLTGTKYAKLKAAKCDAFKLNVSFETSRDASNTQQFVKLTQDMGLGIKIGVKASANVKAKFGEN